MNIFTASGSARRQPRQKPAIKRLAAAALALFALNAYALDFKSVGDPGAVLFDAPSTSAKKLYVVSPGYPLEVIVTLESWVKVRDATGTITWIEKKNLADKRMVLVLPVTANIVQSPAANSPIVFKAERDVVMEVVEAGPPGWIKVKHRDGQAGFVATGDVWGG